MGRVTISIIEHVEPGKVIINCALCRGSGNKPGYKAHVGCDVCSGKGVVLVEADLPLVECRLCNGSGNRPGYKSYVECNQCQGVGAQPLTGSMKIIR